MKAQIKKSFGNQIRLATTLFQDSFPLKAYCECPVGVSGLTCQDSVPLKESCECPVGVSKLPYPYPAFISSAWCRGKTKKVWPCLAQTTTIMTLLK